MTTDPFGVALNSRIPTSDESVALLAEVERAAAEHVKLVAHLDKTFADRRTKAEAEASSLIPTGEAMDETALRIAKAMAARKADREVAEFRKNALAETEKARTQYLRELKAGSDRLEAVVKVFPSPVALLSAQSLGDARRTEYLRQTETSGPAELATLGKLAIANGDRALAAAVLSRLDRLPKNARPFTAQALAEQMVGREHATLLAHAKRASAAFQQAINLDRAIATGKPSTASSIASALRRREADQLTAKASA
jgi:hypothetical protein